jgi:hypothetical protein
MKPGSANFPTIVATVTVLSGVISSPARPAIIIDEWANVKAPPPALKEVTVDPKSTALLLLDFLPGV